MPVESDYPVPGASTKALPVDVNVLYLSAPPMIAVNERVLRQLVN